MNTYLLKPGAATDKSYGKAGDHPTLLGEDVVSFCLEKKSSIYH
jgi:hypothetical protein